MALTQERDTQRRNGDQAVGPVAAATKILAGALVCAQTGANFLTKGATATTLRGIGVADETADNTSGAAGAISVKYRRDGWFRFKNSSAGDAITLADVGADCFIVDDEVVAKTNGTNTRSVAGKVRDVDADGVWISFN